MRTLIVAAMLLGPSVASAEPNEPSFELRDRGDAVEVIAHNVKATHTIVNPIRSRLEVAIAGRPTIKRELRALDPGTTLTLPGFVDSRVPVFCEGTLKAWGRPVVSRGVLAVQIVSIVHGQGAKS